MVSNCTRLRNPTQLPHCHDHFLALVSMTSEQVGRNSDTFLTGMHLAVITGKWFCADFTPLKQAYCLSGGWSRMLTYRMRVWVLQKQRLFIGAKEAKFPYFTKGKPVSSWLILKYFVIFLYKFSFCASNSWPELCFVLSLIHVRHQSPVLTRLIHPTSCAGTLLPTTVSRSEKRVFISF